MVVRRTLPLKWAAAVVGFLLLLTSGSGLAAGVRPLPRPSPPCLGGCPRRATVELPAPNLSGTSPETVLALIRWIASLRDLSDTRKVLGGLNQPLNPDPEYAEVAGQNRLNFTHYLHEAPLIDGSPIKVSYTVFDPHGWAAQQGVSARGDMSLSLDTDRLCITKRWMEKHFGGPHDLSIVTDGGGAAWTWDVGVWKQRHVFVHAYFGPQDDHCADKLDIWQTKHPARSMFAR